jgi:hypothetical protein
MSMRPGPSGSVSRVLITPYATTLTSTDGIPVGPKLWAELAAAAGDSLILAADQGYPCDLEPSWLGYP